MCCCSPILHVDPMPAGVWSLVVVDGGRGVWSTLWSKLLSLFYSEACIDERHAVAAAPHGCIMDDGGPPGLPGAIGVLIWEATQRT